METPQGAAGRASGLLGPALPTRGAEGARRGRTGPGWTPSLRHSTVSTYRPGVGAGGLQADCPQNRACF